MIKSHSTYPVTEHDILLNNGSTLKYVTQGAGENVLVLLGPGTILMNFFSEAFKSKTTLVAIDQDWTYEENTAIDIDRIQQITFPQLIDHTSQAIDALRHDVFPNQRFGLVGMSILTKLAMACAQTCSDIDFVILNGLPFFELSLGFPESDHYFQTHADPAMIQYKKNLQENFAHIDRAETGFERLLLPQSKLKGGKLTPNSQLIENFLTMAPQQCYKPVEYYTLVERFRQGVTNKVINQVFYAHFFENLAQHLNSPQQLLPILAQQGINILIASGEQDMTTPIPEADQPFLQQLVQQYPDQFYWKHYLNCGHYPMTEMAIETTYTQDICQFLSACRTKQAAA